MWKRPLLLLGMAFCLLAGCATISESRLTRQESLAIIELARQKIGMAYPKIDAAEAATIARPPDSFDYYCLAGNHFQYFITWRVATNRFASVYGQGNVRTLDNASVVLRTIPTRESTQDPR